MTVLLSVLTIIAINDRRRPRSVIVGEQWGRRSMGSFMRTARQVDDRGEAADAPPSPRRSPNARPCISGLDFAPSAAILGGEIGSRVVDVPWWMFCLLTVLGLAAVCLQIVFPQDSRDKLAWWSERWRRKQHCQCQAERPVTGSGRGNSP
jgi:hypothetical protein